MIFFLSSSLGFKHLQYIKKKKKKNNRKMAASIKSYVLVVGCMFLMHTTASIAWETHFSPNSTTIQMNKLESVNLKLTNLNTIEIIQKNAELFLISDSEILSVTKQIVDFDKIVNNTWTGPINITGEFLGLAKVYAQIKIDGKVEKSNQSLSVIIIREERPIDRLFTISVVVLVAILYINFGAALDLGKVKEILVRPIGPLIAFVCQFLFMPLVTITVLIT